MTLVLASASPRRAEILTTLGLSFIVRPADVVEERAPGEEAAAMVLRLARAKARAAALDADEAAVVLGADTVVVVDAEVLGKPAEDDEAAAMLSRLAGRWHEVITGVALEGATEHAFAVTTRVRFGALEPEVIARYVATGEGRDKAGAYGIQGIGGGLVERIEGSYTNVVGLPAFEVAAALRDRAGLSWP